MDESVSYPRRRALGTFGPGRTVGRPCPGARAAAAGIKRVWLFRGLGSKGAASQDAIATAHRYGMDVVEGACPLMFLEPVGWFHRVHRRIRRLNKVSSAAA